VTSAEDQACRRRSCHALLTLARTVHTMRQHAGTPRIRDEARRGCILELAALLAVSDFAFRLENGEASCHGHAVLPFGRTDVPFGLLAEEGIGEVLIAAGTPAADLAVLLDLFAAARPPGDGPELSTEIHRAHLFGVHLRAPSGEPPGRGAATAVDWWLFPEPRADAAVHRLVEREMATNLPLVAARLLLADLDETGPVDDERQRQLTRLFSSLLACGDVAAAGWLLEQCNRHPAAAAQVRTDMAALAREAFAGDWLADQVASDDQLPGLLALALELGNDGFTRLETVATAAGRPLPGWITSLLPPGSA
jgi:hypothetical protein